MDAPAIPETPPDRTVADAVCLACGCLCDDIDLTVSGGRIVEARRACAIGRAWFLADHAPGDRPEATVAGRPVDRAEALERAAGILGASRAPLITGLSGTTVEAQRAAVALADRLGATIDPLHADAAAPAIAAMQRVGRVGGTLGEVKNRADVVVFWAVDPVATHPRHLERYSVEPAGRFVPGGRSGRAVLVADSAPTATAALADDVLPVRPEDQFEALWTLRALVRGEDPGPLSGALAISPDRLRAWAERLKAARYGAVFYGEGSGDAATVEALLLLVRDLNEHTRFVALPLGGPGNPSGAEAVLTWQAGSPHAVDLSRGHPRFLPGEASAAALLARDEADAALIVGPGTLDALPPAARAGLARIPTVRIAPDATAPEAAASATVALASAVPGIHAPGRVVRVDGAWLPLRPPLESPRPTDRAWLEAIHRLFDANGAE